MGNEKITLDEYPTIMTRDDLAQLFRVKSITIATRLCKRPDSLPPPLAVSGHSRWLRQTVEQWLFDAAQETQTQVTQEVKNGRGRPRKVTK